MKFIITDYHHIPDHIKSLVKSLYTDFKTSTLTNAFRISWTIDRQVYFQAKAKTYIIHLKPPARRFHFLILPSLQVENKYIFTLLYLYYKRCLVSTHIEGRSTFLLVLLSVQHKLNGTTLSYNPSYRRPPLSQILVDYKGSIVRPPLQTTYKKHREEI